MSRVGAGFTPARAPIGAGSQDQSRTIVFLMAAPYRTCIRRRSCGRAGVKPAPTSFVQQSFLGARHRPEMKRNQKTLALTLASILALTCALLAQQQIGDGPAVKTHMDESDIESGRVSFEQIVAQGRML